jgi:hypothetical protein
VAAGAAAAFFQAARALANPARCAGEDAGDAGCPDESPALLDGEPADAAAPVPAVEVGAVLAREEACPVPGAATG